MAETPMFSAAGRINRRGWWMSQLKIVLIWIGALMAMVAIAGIAGGFSEGPDGANPAATVVFVLGFIGVYGVTIWISIASSVKRYHDRGKEWVWYLVAFIPIVGPIWQLVELGFLPGDPVNNQFGPAPGSHDGAAAYQRAFDEVATAHGGTAATDGYEDATAKALKENARKHARNRGASRPSTSAAARQPRAQFGVKGS